jgi:hypothetical protein
MKTKKTKVSLVVNQVYQIADQRKQVLELIDRLTTKRDKQLNENWIEVFKKLEVSK